MLERLNQYRPILAVLIAACGVMAAVTARFDMTVFYICIIIWGVLAAGSIIWTAGAQGRKRLRIRGAKPIRKTTT